MHRCQQNVLYVINYWIHCKIEPGIILDRRRQTSQRPRNKNSLKINTTLSIKEECSISISKFMTITFANYIDIINFFGKLLSFSSHQSV